MTRARQFSLAFAAVLAAGPGAATAQTPPRDPVAKLDACIGDLSAPEDHAISCKGVVAEPCLLGEAGRDVDGMTGCIAAETAAWDAIRAREYSALIAGLTPAQQAALAESRASWMAFREADCAFPPLFEPSDLGRPWAEDCRMQHTADRALALRGYRDYRGDR